MRVIYIYTVVKASFFIEVACRHIPIQGCLMMPHFIRPPTDVWRCELVASIFSRPHGNMERSVVIRAHCRNILPGALIVTEI